MSKVYVAGSINMDLVATTERFPKPGETVQGTSFSTFPGGKGANQAVAAARVGGHVEMIGKVGADAFGDELRDFLSREHVGLLHAGVTTSQPTGNALIVVSASGENQIVAVAGANGSLTPADVDSVDMEKGDVLVCQFETPLDTIEAILGKARTVGATTILNPAPAQKCSARLLSLVDVLVVNETELAFFAGVDSVDPASVEEVATAARRMRVHPEQVVVVTLGEHGCAAFIGERRVNVAGRVVDVVDTTAAGDCFVGSLAARLASGDTTERALNYANAAASICVQRRGAGPSLPLAPEVDGVVLNRGLDE
jgi:ribokinase